MFSEKGLEGARVDEIVKASGVNVRMLYHYFGSKEGLYSAILIELFESTLFDKDESEISALDLRQRHDHFAKFLIQEPDALSLLVWELAADDISSKVGHHHVFQRICIFLSNPKELWQEFNVTDPVSAAHSMVRQTALSLQLLNAYGPKRLMMKLFKRSGLHFSPATQPES